MYICEHGYTSESNYRKDQKKDRATLDLIKRREVAQEADMFSKLVMEMVL